MYVTREGEKWRHESERKSDESEAAAHEKAGGGDDEHAKRERAAAELVEKRLPTSRSGQPQPPPSHSTRLPAAHKEKRGSRDAL